MAVSKARAKTTTEGEGTTKAMKHGPRADFGAPIDGFFEKQPPVLRAILDALRALVEEVVPEARPSLKWGMPMYEVNGTIVCGFRASKAAVGLIRAGPVDAFPDPDGRLEGEGKTGRQLKLTRVEDLPHDQVRGWLGIAAGIARAG